MAVVKVHARDGQPHFLHDLARGGVLCVLALIDVACDEHVKRPIVLLNEDHAVLCLVHDDHAAGRVEHRPAKGFALIAVRNFLFLLRMIFQMQLRAALHAIVHFHLQSSSLNPGKYFSANGTLST